MELCGYQTPCVRLVDDDRGDSFYPGDNRRVVSPNCIDCDGTIPPNQKVGERYRERCRECANAHRIASATEAQTAALASQTAAANTQAKELAKIAVNQTEAIQRLAEAFGRNTDAMVAIRKQLRRNRNTLAMKNENPTPPSPGLFDRVATIATGIGIDEMAVRAVARQMRKLVKEPIVAALAARSDTSQFVSTARAFLGTEFGDAALSLVMSAAVRYIPVVPQDWREPLAREFVVEGGASIIDTLADVFAAPIREAFANAAGTLANPNIFPPQKSNAQTFDVKPVVPAADTVSAPEAVPVNR